MGRKKKHGFLKFILVILICFILGAAATVTYLCLRKNDSTLESSAPVGAAYSITYRAIENGVEKDIYEPLFKEDGNYPCCYSVGKKVDISPLNGAVTMIPSPWLGMEGSYAVTGEFQDPNDPNVDYSFYGWFTDKECTQKFCGFIPAEATGDKVLYAKIGKAWWLDTAY